jgi:Ca-activated chloride channel family protein
MTFLHPEFLYFMLPPIFILFYFLLTQSEATASFFSAEVFNKLRVNTKMMTLKARNALFLLMFIFFIIALAQPVIEEGKVKVQAKSADIMIALDISDSMLAEDVYPSRLERGKQKILDLLELSPQERLGVTAFARASYLVAPLSFDHRAVHFLVKQLQPSYITEKGTDFMQLLRNASQMMQENEQKYLLILTDGGDQEYFDDEIAYAKEEGIKVFVLGIGTEKGAPIKEKEGGFVKSGGSIVVTTLNKSVSQLATRTGGTYIESVVSTDDITTMFSEITSKTKKRSLKEEEITRYGQLFYIPLGIGMLLLLIATSSMSRREKVHVPLSVALFALVLQGTPSQAGIMDFTLLDDAKAAYEAGDYNRSATLFGEYASRHRSNESLYNTASAYYKDGYYSAAAKGFEQVHFTDETKQFDTLHNLGNAYAKQGVPEQLVNAVATYEKALAIKDDQQTRENLEAVKKRLQEQQEQKPQQGQNGKDQKQEGDQQKDQEQQQHSSGEKSSEDSKKSDAQKEDGQRHKGDQGEPQEQKGSSKDQQQESQAKQPEPVEQQQAKKSGKEEEQTSEENEEGGAAAAATADAQMSEREAQKWLKMLGERPVSHIYRMGDPEEQEREKTDEKPW